MSKILFLLIFYLAAACTAQACSFDQNVPFKPSSALLTLGEDGHPSYEYINWEKLPKPILDEIIVTRGTDGDGMSCDDAGLISFNVRPAPGTNYKIDDLGVYFRVEKGTVPDDIFPDLPVLAGLPEEQNGILFAWLDAPVSAQKPIDFVLEIFFVSSDLSIGPSASYRITSD